ncbi:MAG: thioredoxin family protein [Gammaproteobacteria bacterium]
MKRYWLAAFLGLSLSARAGVPAALPDLGAAPPFAGISGWLNSPPLDLPSLRGKVVLVDFWTYSCINCLRTVPYVARWHEQYRDQGLVVVGVHTPEYPFEHGREGVQMALRRFGIAHPVAQDNAYATWKAWKNQYWPAAYLVDRHGRIRYQHAGEGAYAETEQAIRQLLAEP